MSEHITQASRLRERHDRQEHELLERRRERRQLATRLRDWGYRAARRSGYALSVWDGAAELVQRLLREERAKACSQCPRAPESST